jgi:DNA repair protein RadA/Sms
VFLNVAGGLRIDEPASDLAVIAPSRPVRAGKALPGDVVLWGEVGLTGEVRSVARADVRVREGRAAGVQACVLPAGNARDLDADPRIDVRGVANVAELFEVLELA